MKNMMRLAAFLGGLAMVVVAMTACGGGDETEPSPTKASASPTTTAPTAVATVGDRAQVEALLKAAALQAEDLPSGLTLNDEKFLTNEESAAQESPYPGRPTLEDLNRFGRILGYEASYSPPALSTATGTILSLLVETDVYRDSKGADEHFEMVRQQPSDPGFIDAFQEQVKAAIGDVQDASVSSMPFADMGDDRLAVEMRITAHYAGADQDLNLITQVVGIRRGRAIGFITVTALDSLSPSVELEDLARTFDQRLKDALK
jgi:hypothetical protein